MGNSNFSSPFVSEKCVNLGVVPQLILNNGHVHQLGEVQFALGLPAVESGPQQGRPFQLQHLLTAALIGLQGEQSQMLLLFISLSFFSFFSREQRYRYVYYTVNDWRWCLRLFRYN